MKITDVRITPLNNKETKMKATASITIDSVFVIHNIRVIDNGNKLFVAMPSKKSSNGEYKDIAHPLNIETRQMIQDAVLAEYKAVQDKVSTKHDKEA